MPNAAAGTAASTAYRPLPPTGHSSGRQERNEVEFLSAVTCAVLDARRGPAGRYHLDLHPAAAVGAESRRLPLPGGPAHGVVTLGERLPAAVTPHRHSVAIVTA